MKLRKIIFSLVFVLLLCACEKQEYQDVNNTVTDMPAQNSETTNQETPVQNSDATNQETPTTEDSLQVFLDASLFTELVESGPNYEVYSDKQGHGYYYKINDNDGELITCGYGSWRFNGIDTVNDSLLMLSQNSGMALFSAQFIDVENGRISPVFSKPLGACSDLVAYFALDNDSNIILIVRDMFDINEFYCDFTDESFSTSVFTTSCTAVFSSDQTSVTITYPTPQNGSEQMSKTFDLKKTA